jgi:exonuclease III|tara:strand:- start:62 stop:1120 length:1059 start_codon:yes stop_codon:yes gene_type:complete
MSGKSYLGLDTLILLPMGCLLIASQLAQVISPERIPLLAFAGLVFPYVLMFFLAGVMVRIFRRFWKGLWWPLVLLILIYPSIDRTLGFCRGAEITKSTESVSITSFNVRRFDEYNWIKGSETRTEIFDWISSNPTEIMCFQEFPRFEKDAVATSLDDHKVYLTGRKTGPATVTTLKVIRTINWIPTGERYAKGLITDIVKDSDTLRVYNIHLQSVGLSSEDYDAVRQGISAGSRTRLISRLVSAFSIRAAQTRSLRKHIDTSPYPVIVAGDFNDTPVSYALKTILEGSETDMDLCDSFSSSSEGLGATYVGDIPGLRIDFLLHSESLSPFNFKTHHIELSDHRPVSVILNFR